MSELDFSRDDAIMALLPGEEMPLFVNDTEIRDAWFTPGNDLIWGEGNWVKCVRCLDHQGLPSYHHKTFHT